MPFATTLPAAARSRTAVLPATASPLVADVLSAPERPALVVAASRLGMYLRPPSQLSPPRDQGVGVLPVLASDALALPTAMRIGLRAEEVTWGVETGDAVLVGGGRVVLPDLELRVVRQWRPARVRRVPLGREGAAAGRRRDTVFDPALADRLLGLGEGLTPRGDDVLAGLLLVGYALDAGAALREAVLAKLSRTTDLSGSLLVAAAQGYAVPEVTAYVDAVLDGRTAEADRLADRVRAFGHSSGAALLEGVALATDSEERR